MYCNRCNVEFTDGLRYCKWCGQALADRPRVTSELHVCPNCAGAVQPGWVFCKACGIRLAAPVSDPGKIFCPKCGAGASASAAECEACGTSLASEPAEPGPEPSRTEMIGTCPSCGERLDTGSMYCKACGAAVYTEARPFGGSALLCAACNSYSPIGSTVCRVCGASLVDSDSEAESSAQPRPSTLPDLGEHLPGPGSLEQPEDDSGANTAIFSGPEQRPDSTPGLPAGERGTRSVSPQQNERAGTSALPGVAGSKSEVQAKTAQVPKARITSSVDDESFAEDEAEGAGPSDDSNSPETLMMRSPFTQPPPDSRSVVTRVNQSPYVSDEQEQTSSFSQGQPALDQTVGLGAEPQPEAGQVAASQAPPAKRSGVAIASIVVSALVIIGVIYVIWWFVQGKPAPPAPVAATEPAPSRPAPPPPSPVAPPGMVFINAGAYTIGRGDGDPLEGPAHPVSLAGFFIDRTEVTNADYAKFVGATQHKPPANWRGNLFPAGLENHPVTGISWQDASDYAAWAGKRLPSEAEWEAAARGTDGRKYPWGNDWQPGLANIGLRTSAKADVDVYPSEITEVGKYPQGASPSGALDLVGNVWEWVADELDLYPGSDATLPSPKDNPPPTLRVIRGGAYDGDQKHDGSYRGFLDESLQYPKVGFRCAKSVGR